MNKIKIAFLLCSGTKDPLPSTRISVINMLPILSEAGYEPLILFDPAIASETPDLRGVAERIIGSGAKIAYFQKIRGSWALHAINLLNKAGVATVFGVCDRVDDEMASAATGTIVVTDYLRSLYSSANQHKIFIVHDGIERPAIYKKSYSGRVKRDIKAVLVTSSSLDSIPQIGKMRLDLQITVVGRYPGLSGFHGRLVAKVSAAPKSILGLGGESFSRVNWGPDKVYEKICDSDIGLIPVDMSEDLLDGAPVSHWQVKSENRLTLKMAVGLPVVASPVPAYLGIIKDGINGYIARSDSDWRHAIEDLRDPGRRERVGTEARRRVINDFSQENQAMRLLNALDMILSVRSP